METKLGTASTLCLPAILFACEAHARCGDLLSPAPRAAAVGCLQLDGVRSDQSRVMRAAFVKVSDRPTGDAEIVGLWKFTFVARGNPPSGPGAESCSVGDHGHRPRVGHRGGNPHHSGPVSGTRDVAIGRSSNEPATNSIG
jgi:hypothetical protein